MRSGRPTHRHYSGLQAEVGRLEIRRPRQSPRDRSRPQFPHPELPEVEAPPRRPVPKLFPRDLDVQWKAAEPRLRTLPKRAHADPSPNRLANLAQATAAEAPQLALRHQGFQRHAQMLGSTAEAQPHACLAPAGFAGHPVPPDPPAEEQPPNPSPSVRPARAPWPITVPTAAQHWTIPSLASGDLPPASSLGALPISVFPAVRRPRALLSNRAPARLSATWLAIALWSSERCCARRGEVAKVNSKALPQPGRFVAHAAAAGWPIPAIAPSPRRSQQNARAAIPETTSTASWWARTRHARARPAPRILRPGPAGMCAPGC
jgi:hypothetical protein